MTILGGAMESHQPTQLQLENVMEHALMPAQISECALFLNRPPGEPCISPETTSKIGSVLHITGDNKTIIAKAKEQLSCDSERCVIGKLTGELGESIARKEINTNLKIKGPTDTKLLSNVNIDSTLKQWTIAFPDFYAYSFNMLNYASYSWDGGYITNSPDTLATIQWHDLYNGTTGKKYNCAACIINSDTYQGEGKHWMALFADARHGDRWTVEFFNSSGNSPAPEWVSWLIKTRNSMESILDAQHKKIPVEIIKASDIRHQKSRSECGLYSLFYVWARLNGIPPEFFKTKHIPDKLMFEFRQHLFADPNRPMEHKFDWNEYQKTVKIDWE